jgi:hypothetical protein
MQQSIKSKKTTSSIRGNASIAVLVFLLSGRAQNKMDNVPIDSHGNLHNFTPKLSGVSTYLDDAGSATAALQFL